MKNKLRSIAFAALLVVLIGVSVFGLFKQTRMFAIQAVPLEWNERLNNGRMEAEITREIEAGIGGNLGMVMGKRPWEVNLEALGRSIKQIPWIEEARIQRVFPDRLVVSISPKKPLAVIVTAQSSLRPISSEGELMPEWKSTIVPDVPFLRGEIFTRDPIIRDRAVTLIRGLPSEGVLARANLAEIGWQNGFTLLLLSPRTEIQLGRDLDSSVIETKLRRVAQVLNYLSTQQKKAPVIDATSVKKVVVRAHHRP